MKRAPYIYTDLTQRQAKPSQAGTTTDRPAQCCTESFGGASERSRPNNVH